MIYQAERNLASNITNAINSYTFDYAHFCAAMGRQDAVAQANFISLSFFWAQRAASDAYQYDGRNEYTHLVCKEIFQVMENAGISDIPQMTSLDTAQPTDCSTPRTPEALAAMIGAVITGKDFDKDIFLLYMERQHRTLQQSFARLCLFWIRWVANIEHPDDSSLTEAYDFCRNVIKAVDLAKVNTGLPLI